MNRTDIIKPNVIDYKWSHHTTMGKYIIFLQPHYFKYYIFKSIFKKIIKNLELKGIVVFNIETFIDELKHNKPNTKISRTIGSKKINKPTAYTTCYFFDDMPYPTTNTLYILLCTRNKFRPLTNKSYSL